MIIESLSIIDYKEKTGASYSFYSGTNLIVSNGNKKGKSSLLKSIYYTLGFDIRQFPSGWNEDNKVFQLKAKFEDGITHTILRQGNIYKVDSEDTPLNLKEYSKWFQNILGIDMKLPNKTTKELHPVYSSAILLPFYIDQDDSWDGSPYRKVSDSLGQYSDVPKGIFEYLFSISDIEVQELQNEINKYTELIRENVHAIKNLTKVLSNYVEEISDVPEVVEIDRKKLDEEIKHYLNLVNTYTEKALEYRIKLVKKQEKLDFLRQDYDELAHLLKMNKKRHKYIENECKYCHSKLTQEQSLTRLGLNNNEFEIIVLKDKVFKNIETLKLEVGEFQLQQVDIEKKIDEINNRIKKSKKLLTIDEYINAKAKTVAVIEMEKNVQKESLSKVDYESKKKQKQAEKNKLLREKADLKEEIISLFETAKNKIKRSLSIANLDDFNFLQFKKINGSGMDKNTKYLGNYLMYFTLMTKYSVYRIPFCMDSFIKNEISPETAKVLFSAIEDYFLALDNQVFFSIVTDNLKYLRDTKKYNIIQIEEHLLNPKNYELLSSQIL